MQYRGLNRVAFAPEVAKISTYLKQRVNVHLLGTRGSGRSQLLKELAESLRNEGGNVLFLKGYAALKNEALGCFSNIELPEDSTSHTLPDVVNWLRRFSQHSDAVLIVDDADELDQASIGAIQVWHSRTRTPTVICTRPQYRKVELPALRLSPSVCVKVSPLELSRLYDLAVDILGGPIDPQALSKVAMRSGGTYGLAAALLKIGKQDGLFVKDSSDIWVAVGDLWSDLLLDVAESYLQGIDLVDLEGATTLAITGPLPLYDAQTLIGADILRNLHSYGLIRYTEYASNAVTGIFPPLLADYLQREGSPAGKAKALEFYSSYVTSNSLSGADLTLISHQMMRRANKIVERKYETWKAESNAKNALELVTAMQDSGADAAGVNQVIQHTTVVSEDLDSAIFTIWTAKWNVQQDGNLDEALANVEAYRKEAPRFDSLLLAGLAHIGFLYDRFPSAKLLTVSKEVADQSSTELLTGVYIETSIAKGEISKAKELLKDYVSNNCVFSTYSVMWQALADMFNGDLEDGIQLALTHLERAQKQTDTQAIQYLGYAAALGLGFAGRTSEADKVVEGILATFPVAAFQNFSNGGLLSLGAMTAFWQGHLAYAHSLTARLLTNTDIPGPFPGMVSRSLAAMDEFAKSGSRSGSELWDVVVRRIKDGYVAAGLLLALAAVEHISDNPGVAQVEATLQEVDSPILKQVAEYIIAANKCDTDEMALAIAAFVASGYLQFAIRAGVLRALILRQRGDSDLGAAQAEETWELSKVCGAERGGLFSQLVEDVGLTSREYEVVRVLASGLTNSETARMLDMSIRTVETHLHNISRKTGLAGRDALIRAVNTWLQASEN